MNYRQNLIKITLIIPILFGFFNSYRFGVDIPIMDEWVIIHMLRLFHEGLLPYDYLFQQHVAHIIFFPQIIFLLTNQLIGYDSKIFMYISQFLFLINLLIIYLKISKQFKFKIANIPLWFIPIPFLIFSWRQLETMLSAFQLTFAMALTFSLLTIYLLDRMAEDKYCIIFFLSILSVIIASFSSAMGLIIWFSSLFQLILKKGLSHKTVYICIWIVFGISSWIFYIIGLQESNNALLQYTINHPLYFIEYFLAVIGGGFYRVYLSITMGVIFLALFIILTIKIKNFRENAFWYSISLFSIFVSFFIACGRTYTGLPNALAARYIPFSFLLILSIYIFLVQFLFVKKNLSDNPKSLRRFNKAIITLTLIGSLITYGIGYFYFGKMWFKEILHRKEILMNYKNMPDDSLQLLYPFPNYLKPNAKFWYEQKKSRK